MLGLSKDVSKNHFGPGALKLQDSKVGGQKKGETFWVRGYVFRDFTIVNLVFGRSGFVFGRCKL